MENGRQQCSEASVRSYEALIAFLKGSRASGARAETYVGNVKTRGRILFDLMILSVVLKYWSQLVKCIVSSVAKRGFLECGECWPGGMKRLGGKRL